MPALITGRQRAQRLLPVLGVCAECEVAPAVERHHWDGDPLNNTANVVPVCRRCHNRLHWRYVCVHGHPVYGENLYVDPKGRRFCRECARVAARRSGRTSGWTRQRNRAP